MPRSPQLPLKKIAAALILLTSLFSLSRAEVPNRPQPTPVRFAIRAEALPLNKLQARRAIGLPLRATGFWALTSEHLDFGGLSAVVPVTGGLRSLSDNGALIDFSIAPGEMWAAHIAPFPRGCQRSEMKVDRDSESIVSDMASGTFWLGLESRNAVCRVTAHNAGQVIAPPAMGKWPVTGGPEAMVRLRDGRFMVFQESPADQGQPLDLLLFDRDPLDPRVKVRTLRFIPPSGFSPVDAAELPDGRLLILVRRFELPFRFSAQLLIARLPGPRARTFAAEPVVWFDRGASLENWEGLGVQDLGQGRARIWMIADDNFIKLQKTVLLRMEWEPPSRDR